MRVNAEWRWVFPSPPLVAVSCHSLLHTAPLRHWTIVVFSVCMCFFYSTLITDFFFSCGFLLDVDKMLRLCPWRLGFLLSDLSAFPSLSRLHCRNCLMPSESDLIMFSPSTPHPWHSCFSLPWLSAVFDHCRNPSSRWLWIWSRLRDKIQIYTVVLFFFFYSLCSLWLICNAVSTHTHTVFALPLSSRSSLQGTQTPVRPATASLLSHYTNVRSM